MPRRPARDKPVQRSATGERRRDRQDRRARRPGPTNVFRDLIIL
jgi:hypothetical protein